MTITAIAQTPVSHRVYLARKYYVGFNFELATATGTPLLDKASLLEDYAAAEYGAMGRRSVSWSESDIQPTPNSVLTAKPVTWFNNSGSNWTFRQVFLQRLDNLLIFQLISFPSEIIVAPREEFKIIIGGSF